MGPNIIDVLLEYYPIFLKGAPGTLKIVAIAVGFGTLLGTIFGFLHLSKSKIIRSFASLYSFLWQYCHRQ